MAALDHDISLGLPTMSPAVPGRWVHSVEEDAGGVEVYRAASEFPPGPRDAFEVSRNGTAIIDTVGADGEIVRRRGAWRQPTVDRLVLSFGEGDQESFMLQAVDDVDIDVLRARRFAVNVPTISPAIPGRWIHSFEEDHDGVEVYRSEGCDLPPSPRTAFDLLRDGSVVLDDIHRAGAVAQVRGRWNQPTDDRLEMSFDGGVHDSFILQAVGDVKPELLTVLRLPERTAGAS